MKKNPYFRFSPPRYMECIESVCMGPGALMDLSMSSHFCLVPSGGNAAKSVGFTALVAGCIPVIFDDFFTQKQVGRKDGRILDNKIRNKSWLGW